MTETTDQINSALRDSILDAAIKRFSWFGINKTTLTEIADDLSLPRHSLNQIFNDKSGLIAAVEEKVIQQYINELNEQLSGSEKLFAALKNLVQIRLCYFQKYFRFILSGEPNEINKWSALVGETLLELKEKELKLLEDCLCRYVDHPRNYAFTLLDTLRTFEIAFKFSHALPTEHDFKELAERQLAVVKLIAQGFESLQTNNQ